MRRSEAGPGAGGGGREGAGEQGGPGGRAGGRTGMNEPGLGTCLSPRLFPSSGRPGGAGWRARSSFPAGDSWAVEAGAFCSRFGGDHGASARPCEPRASGAVRAVMAGVAVFINYLY